MRGKQVFVIGILLIPVGFIMVMLGRQEMRQANELEARPEAVSLQQLIDGDHVNEHLFLLSEFRPAEFAYTETSKRSSVLDYSWVPLYPTGQDEDDGEQIRVIARLLDVANVDELYAILEQDSVVAQVWNFSSHEISNLQEHYPRLDTRNIIEVWIGDELPSRRAGIVHFCWAALWFTLGAGCILHTVFFHLDILGRRRPSTSVAYDIYEVDRKKWKLTELALLDAEAARFAGLGFQPISYVEEKRDRTTKRRVLHLSSNRKYLLSVSVSGKRALSTLLGIADNGQCLSIGQGADALTIDGISDGVPLLVHTFPEIVPDQMMTAFETLEQTLGQDVKLAPIEPTQAMELVRYRASLIQWWTLLKAYSDSVPPELPQVDDLFQLRDGVRTFCWGATVQAQHSQQTASQWMEPIAVER